jgi:hypothetical protein
MSYAKRCISLYWAFASIIFTAGNAFAITVPFKPTRQDEPFTFAGIMIPFVVGILSSFAAIRAASYLAGLPPNSPGSWLLKLCDFLELPGDHPTVQAIADMQHEYRNAKRIGNDVESRRVRLHGYVDFVRTAVAYIAMMILDWVAKNLKSLFRTG